MTSDNQTTLRFSLKESVWFQKGQEVSELLSISLYPDIEIHERDYEVLVKGALLLTGEYIAEEGQEEPFSLRELSPVRTIDSIYIREDGISELSHAFPLEISIPRERVLEVNDLYVTVESFDYELPEAGCLQLIADLSIGGLRDLDVREEEEEIVDDQEEEEIFLDEEEANINNWEKEETIVGSHDNKVEEILEEDLFKPFELEARKEPKIMPTLPIQDHAPQLEWYNQKEEVETTTRKDEIKAEPKAEVDSELKAEVNTRPNVEVKAEPKAEVKVEPKAEVKAEPKAEVKVEPKAEVKVEPKVEVNTRPNVEIKAETNAEVIEEQKFEYSHRDENALYLTKLFTKEREDEFTKLRLYFVQQGDTIESITERYDITLQQLTRLNNLEDLYVQEGEILYIPVSKTANKQ